MNLNCSTFFGELMRYRLIKPLWANKYLDKKKEKSNKDYVKFVEGAKIYEGDDSDYSDEFLEEMNNKGYNIYYFPNDSSTELPENRFLSGRDVDTFSYVYVDMDLKDNIYKSKKEFLTFLSKFPVKPSYTVDSGHGIHVYWNIKDLVRDEYPRLQKRLAAHFKSDDTVFTVLQLMRLPGYYNTKNYEDQVLCDYIEKYSTEEEYTTKELAAVLSPITEEDEKSAKSHLDKLDGLELIEFEEYDLEDLPEKFVKLLETNKRINDMFNDPQSTHGDRSRADLALAGELYRYDLTKKEAIQVLMNSLKAKSRTMSSRITYAQNTVNKAYLSRAKYAASNVSSLMKTTDTKLGDLVKGPHFLDCLESGWRKTQVLGMIAGSGTGKTSMTLKIISDLIQNNPDNDDIFFFFSLEMPTNEIVNRWGKLTSKLPSEDQRIEAMNRLYVIGKDFFQNKDRDITPNLQKIYKIVKDTTKKTGKEASVIAIDHIDVVAGDIDITQYPHFNAKVSSYVERKIGNNIVVLNKDGICQKFKELAQQLNCFIILQSQTTKDKDGGGDIPIGKNAAFGTSMFEWYSDYVIGLWRPLNKLSADCKERDLYVTAFQYTKIREQNSKKDLLGIEEKCLVKFDPDYEDFLDLTEEDKDVFDELIPKANKAREIEAGKNSTRFRRAPINALRLLKIRREKK